MDFDVRWSMDGLDKLRAAGEKCVLAITQTISTTSSQILVLIACLLLAWITSSWTERQVLLQIQEKNRPSHLLLMTVLQQSGYSEVNEQQITKLDLKRHFPLVGEKSPLFWKTENFDWVVYLHPISEGGLREMLFFTRVSAPHRKSPTATEWSAVSPLPSQLQWNGFLEALIQLSPAGTAENCDRMRESSSHPIKGAVWRHPRELKY